MNNNNNEYQYKIAGIPTDLNTRKTLTGHAYAINKQQLIKALQGLSAKQINISVTLDVTEYVSLIMENSILAKLAFSVVILILLLIIPIFFMRADNSDIVSALFKFSLDTSVLVVLVNDIITY